MTPQDPMPNSVDTAAETLPILYRDEHLVAINKPTALLVHRSMIDRHETRFALQILRDQLGQYVYPVHRLDKPTSGVMVFALSPEIARLLSEQFSSSTQRVAKHYLALTRGYAPENILVDHPLKEKHDKMTDRKAQQDKPAQEAITEFQRLAKIELPIEIEGFASSRYSLVDCAPQHGRKHQLRRHCKHISHPIIGDARYGRGRHNRYFKENLDCPRLMLHAYRLQIKHPISEESMDLWAPLDSCWQQLIKRFDWNDSLPTRLQPAHNNPHCAEPDMTGKTHEA